MNRYRVRYVWSTDAKLLKSQAEETFFPWSKDFEAPTPISAINQFHRFVQEVREMAPDRVTVLRPRLGPANYRVLSLHQFYHDASLHKNPSAQPIIESSIDYPKSPNPDLLHLNRGGRGAFDKAGEVAIEFDFGANPRDGKGS